ncbi:MAG: IS200/IS605 family transposase [Candidatus Micrarchaeota archaeon]
MSGSVSESLARNAHSVGQSAFHFEWCPKYRFAIFSEAVILKACEESLRRAAARHGLELMELSVMPDHVHAIAVVPPTLSISSAMQYLKGASAHDLFAQFPKLRERYWGGHLWSPGKFYRSVGDTTLQIARHYVKYDNDPHQRSLSNYS